MARLTEQEVKEKKAAIKAKEKIIAIPRAVSIEDMFNAILDEIGALHAKVDQLLK